MTSACEQQKSLAVKLHDELKKPQNSLLRKRETSVARIQRLRARPWATLPVYWKVKEAPVDFEEFASVKQCRIVGQ